MSSRLPSVLFSVTLAIGLGLASAVVAAPFILGERPSASDLVLLFARDMTVRRTAFFCSVGLVATAFIFFRPPTMKKKKNGPAVNMTGA